MASSADHTIATAALGRPFGLGMLYDCRSDVLIPGRTLWENDDLQKHTVERKQQNSEFRVTASDSIDEKSESLNVSGSLKLSLLGGLVNVSGSSKYFEDTKKSYKQHRLTLQYKTTTKYESLSMSHLGCGQVSHPNVFEDGSATHVVTAILYGASAYFIFDRESSNDEDKSKVEGEVKLMMNKLKFLQVDAESSLDMNEEEKSALKKVICTFHGDFHLPSNPSTFKEAMDAYSQLPTLLGENGEDAVPVRVWLYPLLKLDSNAAKLQREISNNLITYTSGVIEHLNKTEMRCNDLLKDTAATTFPVMKEKLQTFMQNCRLYKLEFVQMLGSVLPSIRGGREEESAIEDILKAHDESPFNNKDLDQWLTKKEKEVYAVQSLLKQLEKVGAYLDDNLDDLLSDFRIKNIVSFSFTLVDQPDRFLFTLSHFLKIVVDECAVSNAHQTENMEWFSSNTRQSIRRQLQLFEQLKKLNNSDDTKFIVSSKYDEHYPGACIFIYEDGSDEPVPFIPPSKPATPTTSDVSYDRFTIEVSGADTATVQYLVEFRMKHETEWNCYHVQRDQKTATLSGLKPATEYEIRATAVGKLGYAVSSKTISAVTDKTTMNQTANVEVKEVKADSITLTWTNLSDQECQFVIVEYKMKTETEWTESDPMKKNQEAVTLSGLQPDTEYEIKVTAVGKQGCTASSGIITAVTAKTITNPPTHVEVTEVRADSIKLTWRNLSDQEYRFLMIEYRMTHETEWNSHSVQKNQETVTLSGLKLDTEYVIRVTAVDKQGGSVSSDVVSAVTAKMNLTPPTNVEIKEVRADSITLTWKNPSDQECQFVIIEYRVTHGGEWNSHPVSKNLETTSLSGLNLDTEYEIRVTAVGKLGYHVSSDAVTAVTAKTTMNPPTNVEIKKVRADSITLTWKNPSDQECQFVIIEYRVTHGGEWNSHPVSKNLETTSLSGLNLDTEYEIRVTAVGKLGYHVSSDAVTAVTAKTTMNPPTNVEIKEVRADSITLTWKNPSDQECQFVIIEYRVTRGGEWNSHPVSKNLETTSLSGLNLDTEYEIKVTAVGKQGCTASSGIITAVTAKTITNPPTHVEVTEVRADSIKLTWRNLSDQEYRFLMIEYRMTHETEWNSHSVQKNQETVTLSGLKLDTEYVFRVTAVDKQGGSVSSDVVSAVTAKMNLTPPTNVEIKEVRANSITLTWKNPSDQECQFVIIEYRVTHGGEWNSHPVSKNLETTSLSGLNLDTEYEIRVTAVGKLGYNVSSYAVTAVTPKTTMNPPTNVEIKEVRADSITLTWKNPSDQECQFVIIEYRVTHGGEWNSHPVSKNLETTSLSGLKLDTEYDIRVTAVGKLGYHVSSDAVTAVTAKTTMNPPTNLEIKEVKADAITLTWKNPSDQQFQFLIVEYRILESCEWNVHPVMKNQETVTLSELQLDTAYEIKVKAVGKDSVSSDSVTDVTKAINPPTNVEVTSVESDSIALSLMNVADQQYQWLTIEYRVVHETEWATYLVQKNQEKVTLSGLNPDTEYEIRVTAVSKQGCSVSSDSVKIVTKAMSPPTDVKVTQVKADSITLTWRNPSDNQYQSLCVENRMKQDSEWTSDPVKKGQETITLSGLELNTVYEIRVTAMVKHYSVSSGVLTATTKTISAPTNVEVTQVKSNSMTLTWSKPEEFHQVKQYIIEYKENNSRDWQRVETRENVYTFTLLNLERDTIYSIRMCTDTHKGMSKHGITINKTTKKGPHDGKRFVLNSSGNPPVYLLNSELEKETHIKKKVFGEAPNKWTDNKTIMLVGATGSGKTTLINGMINYILGVDWEDNWRFKLIDEETNKSQAHSQTSEVTAYQIHHKDEFKIPYSLTIVDTPGFGDTRGIKQDKAITERIRQFFINKNSIDAIDAVCVVVQASSARLTHTQRYVFESILSVFGKNIASNIITLVTFADGKTPPVLEAIKEANIPCAKKEKDTPLHFKFNNSALFAENTGGRSDEADFDCMFWRMGEYSMKKFFEHLHTLTTQSLSLTKEVLKERKQLGTTVEGMQPLIRKGLSTMEEIRTIKAVLENHKTQIEANKDFEYEVEVEKSKMIKLELGTYVTNCQKCNYTCHFPCMIPKDSNKIDCAAMEGGSCTVCPSKCVWTLHHNMEYRWEFKREKERGTYQELKSKFETACGDKMNAEKMAEQLQVEYDGVKEEVVRMMQNVTRCLERLQKIALRPDPLATPDYIDQLIESEKQEAKPGWQQRIKELQEVRQEAVLMQNMKHDIHLNAVCPGYESFSKKTNKGSKRIVSNVMNWFGNLVGYSTNDKGSSQDIHGQPDTGEEYKNETTKQDKATGLGSTQTIEQCTGEGSDRDEEQTHGRRMISYQLRKRCGEEHTSKTKKSKS